MNIHDKNSNLAETSFENSVRPQNFDSFIGQTDLKDSLSLYVKASIKKGIPLDHVLFYGCPGLGKTTLAKIIANSLGSNFVVTSGAIIEKPSDLINTLVNLNRGDVLFIDEIHRIPKIVEEFMYPALEDCAIDIMVDSEKGKNTHRVELAKFTVIGATTRAGMLSAPLRERFGIDCRLEYYNEVELKYIVKRTSEILKVKISDTAAELVAKGSRGTPRIANRIVRRCHDYAIIEANNNITLKVVKETFKMLRLYKNGLNAMDNKILKTMLDVYGGKPVGINALAATVAEDVETIEIVNEPFLIQNGYIERTSRGRIITDKAIKFLSGR
ncbi:MAG: Holliday junction branch migration DNA helicase RuvB [Methanothrix sp.]|jgi:Holliday junction DNA helicase RuvB|nr:Holliday junction branch migration DNA helicase RuvB [Methanothrix sp.]